MGSHHENGLIDILLKTPDGDDNSWINITNYVLEDGFPEALEEQLKGDGYFDYQVKDFTFSVLTTDSVGNMTVNTSYNRYDNIKFIVRSTGQTIFYGFIDEVQYEVFVEKGTVMEITVQPSAVILKDVLVGELLSDDPDEENYEFDGGGIKHIREIINDALAYANDRNDSKINFTASTTTIPNGTPPLGLPFIGNILQKKPKSGFFWNLLKLVFSGADHVGDSGGNIDKFTVRKTGNNYYLIKKSARFGFPVLFPEGDWVHVSNAEWLNVNKDQWLGINEGQWLQILEGQWLTVPSGTFLSISKGAWLTIQQGEFINYHPQNRWLDISKGDWIHLSKGDWLNKNFYWHKSGSWWSLTVDFGHLYVPNSDFDFPGGDLKLPPDIVVPAHTTYVPKEDFNLPDGDWDIPGEDINIPWTEINVPGWNIRVPNGDVDVPNIDIRFPTITAKYTVWRLVGGGFEYVTELNWNPMFPFNQNPPSLSQYGSLYNSTSSAHITHTKVKTFLKSKGYSRDIEIHNIFDYDEGNSYVLCSAKKKGFDLIGDLFVLSFETPFDDEYSCTYLNESTMKICSDISKVSNRYFYVSPMNEVYLLPRSYVLQGYQFPRINLLELKRRDHRDTEVEIDISRLVEDAFGEITDYGIRLRKNEYEGIKKFYKEYFSRSRIEYTTKFYNPLGKGALLMTLRTLDTEGVSKVYGTVIETKRSFREPLIEVISEDYI